MGGQDAAARRLLEMAAPLLHPLHHDRLAARLRQDWSPACLALLCQSPEPDIAEVAATCLGLIGELSDAPALARLLHHECSAVVDAAEHALWAIWFRDGGEMGCAVLWKIARSIQDGETENVVTLLTELLRSQPTYAEAFHQRSQARYMENAFDASLRDARRAFELNPLHFGALAVQANALAALGQFNEALRIYRRVLRIHPHMHGIRPAIQEIRGRLHLSRDHIPA